MFFFGFLTLALGLVFGSFVGAITYRIPRGKSFTKGRSNCDGCGNQISWYDNIPLLSFLILKGKCRHCSQKISIRYPIIEVFVAILFLLVYFAPHFCNSFLVSEVVCTYSHNFGIYYYPLMMFIMVVLSSIFIIDLETFLIPDKLVYAGFLTIFATLLASGSPKTFEYLFAGFLIACLLLSIHLLTKGKGMGLGDVKLAVFIGSIFTVLESLEWLFLAFLTGGIVGIILILGKKAKLKQEIPFGPFLVFSFFLTFFLGGRILRYFF